MENKKKDNSRRSALKKIAGTGALILGMPLSNVLWAKPNSGIMEESLANKAGAKSVSAPLFASATTRCAFVTTNSTTRPLFGTPSPSRTTFGTTTTTGIPTSPPPTTTGEGL